MTCIEVQQQISAFVDGQLREEESAPVFGHIGQCAECRGFLLASVRMQAMIAKIPPPAVPTHLDARVLNIPLAANRAARPRGTRVPRTSLWRQRLHVPVPALAAGLAMVILTAALSLWLWFGPLREPKLEVVYVFGMPQIEVYGTSAANPPGERKQ
jgi:anti-sigma factor RsiW